MMFDLGDEMIKRWGEEIDAYDAMLRGVNAAAVRSLFSTMDAFDLMRVPDAEQTHSLEVERDLAYGDPDRAPWRLLDVWRPAEEGAPRAAILFIHGGGFRSLSKRTHWAFARTLARMGHVVFTIDYRLGPKHPFPAPLEDASYALAWVRAHAERYGADPERIALAGESAGANLACALGAARSWRIETDWGQRAWEAGRGVRSIVGMSGLFQVSDPERFAHRGHSQLVLGPMRDAAACYLPEAPVAGEGLIDPLLFIERAAQPERPLPALFAPVGERDPLADDSERLSRAWRALGAPAEARVYEGGHHSFMAFAWTARAQRCWSDVRDHLGRAFDASISSKAPFELAG